MIQLLYLPKILDEPSSEKKLQDLFVDFPLVSQKNIQSSKSLPVKVVGCNIDFVQSAPHTHLITYKKRCLTFDVEWFVQESCRNQEKPYLII